ncbi:MAG: hypothetical protein AB1555_01065 [Nitrospirota bacterium]
MSQKELLSPPRYIQNERGEIVEVIVSVEDYRRFLRTLAAHTDWESLPSYLQDAIDRLLAEEARAEEGPSKPLRDVLSESGRRS